VPKTVPAYLINLGNQGAQNVKARLRNPPNKRHNVFAEGIAPLITKRGEAIGVLPWPPLWPLDGAPKAVLQCRSLYKIRVNH
jgi:hypothetical protein